MGFVWEVDGKTYIADKDASIEVIIITLNKKTSHSIDSSFVLA